ncbi:phosphocarrier protein HPr [bacterium I07]|nr:phosphocarrier protein HPr [bacterium I07]
MIEECMMIRNKMGLHARPAALFVETASRFDAEVTIIKDGLEVNGKSIMGLLMLAAEKGSEITLRTDGKDEVDMFEALKALLDGKFDED